MLLYILKTIKTFIKSKNKSRREELLSDPHYLSSTDLPRLMEIVIKEILEAIKAIKSNKCPGTDGITINFYKKFFLFTEAL